MDQSTQLPACPECGATLTQGLCPRCLMAAAAVPTQPTASPMEPVSIDQVSAAFPHLQVLEMIGQGGMGSVFKVRQPKLDRFAALKLLPQSLAADSAFAGRFEREARLLAKLNHPNIVAVYDYGQAGNFFYLLMEYVDGVNLRQAMRASRFEPRQALGIVPKICDALQYAHDEGVLHRDIKPENILLDTKGRVKLVDFGIAKLAAEADPGIHPTSTGDPTLTQAGVALGTPNYMAPEQRDHPSNVDHRADIYSLGVVFYELLTGELPIGGSIRPSEKSGADPRVDAIVQQAMQTERDRRQHSAGEVRLQVETVAGSPPPAAKIMDAFVGQSPRKTGLVRLVELLFDAHFISPIAIKLINFSTLGFFAFLGYLPLPGMQRCFGFAGLFGLIGAAFVFEGLTRYKTKAGIKQIQQSAPAQRISGSEQPDHPILAIVAACFWALSGIVSAVAWFRMPQPPQMIVWAIPATSLLAVLYAIPAWKNRLGKSALIGGAICLAVWLIIAVITWHTESVPEGASSAGVSTLTGDKRSLIEARLRMAIAYYVEANPDQMPHDYRNAESITVAVASNLLTATAYIRRPVPGGGSAGNGANAAGADIMIHSMGRDCWNVTGNYMLSRMNFTVYTGDIVSAPGLPARLVSATTEPAP